MPTGGLILVNWLTLRLIGALRSFFPHEFIGRNFGINFELADLPLFVGRVAFHLGQNVWEVQPAHVLVLGEGPAIVSFGSLIEPLLKFLRSALALFGRNFYALDLLSTLSWLPGLSRLSRLPRLSGLRALLLTLSALPWLPSLSALLLTLSALPAAGTTWASSATHHCPELFGLVAEADQLMSLLIKVKAHVETVGPFAVEHVELTAFGARSFADERKFNLSRGRRDQQPAEHDLVKLAALLQLHEGRNR